MMSHRDDEAGPAPMQTPPEIEEALISGEALAQRVRELGAQISADYAGRELLMIGVLRGVLVFMADLLRAVAVPTCVDFVRAASYGASVTSSGNVRITARPDEKLAGRHVLVVDTVLDTGLTLQVLDADFRQQEPASLRYCVLLAKDLGAPPLFSADYVGFTVPNRWLVGYGCDYGQRFRNLPYLGVLRRSVYESTGPTASGDA